MTGGHTLQDGIPNKSVWSPNYVTVNETHVRRDSGKDARAQMRQEFFPPEMDVRKKLAHTASTWRHPKLDKHTGPPHKC